MHVSFDCLLELAICRHQAFPCGIRASALFKNQPLGPADEGFKLREMSFAAGQESRIGPSCPMAKRRGSLAGIKLALPQGEFAYEKDDHNESTRHG
jgi:hypothetical protein